jgi:hypothetical protein
MRKFAVNTAALALLAGTAASATRRRVANWTGIPLCRG